MPDEDKTVRIQATSKRLLTALGVLLALMAGVLVSSKFIPGGFSAATPSVTAIVGIIGGFVGLQRRLKTLDQDDLYLVSTSWIYTVLPPVVGGVLALLIYVLFLSGLLAGDLFPKFQPDQAVPPLSSPAGFESIFATHGAYSDYAKLIFWAFVAGYSERFVVNILGQFEKSATDKTSGQ